MRSSQSGPLSALRLAAFALFAALATSAGCEGLDVHGPTFACTTNADCAEGYECMPRPLNKKFNKACVERSAPSAGKKATESSFGDAYNHVDCDVKAGGDCSGAPCSGAECGGADIAQCAGSECEDATGSPGPDAGAPAGIDAAMSGEDSK